MAFEKKVPEWNAEGVEPPESLKTSGFEPGMKPPAAHFNWFWNGISKAVKELQEKVATAADLLSHTGNKNNPHGVTPGQIGAATAKELSDHTGNKNNPHGVTAEQVGAATPDQLNAHANNKNNPHGVTASQIGAAAAADLTSHTGNKNNPHGVTAEQVGAAAAVHKHSASDIDSGTLPITRGGTGGTYNPSMLTDLGSSSAASVFSQTPRPGVTGILPIANGGTGATDAATARSKLGAAAADHKHSASDITGISSVKTARFVVGTSANGWTAADCDYLCDGTADEAEINAAITALPSTGGEVVLLDGTYTITAEIKLNKANATLRGSGHGTKIVRGFDAGRMIYLSDGYGIVENLKLDGAKSTYTTSSSSYGIYAMSSHNTVRDCSVTNCAGYGIYFAAAKNKAVGNIVTACATGIQASDELCIISSNICNENASYGISLQDNHIVVTGNIAKLNGASNFYMFYCQNCTITGNDFSVMDGDSVTPRAIYLYSSYSEDNIITNNQVGIGEVTADGGSGNIVGNPGYTYGTTDLTAGSSELTTGQLYFVYE